MANLFDQMKRRLSGAEPNDRAESPKPAGPLDEGAAKSATADTVRTVDSRRVAEQKAEDAGRKWRAQAEARGDVEKEIGGPQGLEPTRYGDWEKAGRCIDF